MRRPTLLLASLAMLIAACAEGPMVDVTPSTDTPATTAAPASGGSSSPSETTSPPVPPSTAEPGGTTSTTVVADDRPIAPDFTLALGDGGTFVLSEETRPVYLVFWAEW